MSTRINLQELAGGAVAEKIDMELQKVLENIADPNTDPRKSRKLQVTLTFKADDNRDIANLSTVVKATTVPAKPTESKVILDIDENGMITGAELKSSAKGQCYIDETGDIADDKGNKIIDLRAKEN